MNRPHTTVHQHRAGGVVRMLAVLAALLLTALVLPGTASAAPPSRGGETVGWLRVGHLAPGTGKADVLLTPVSSGPEIRLNEVEYGVVSDFRRVPVGRYTVAFSEAGSPATQEPMLTQTVRVRSGSATTLLATRDQGEIVAKVLTDDLTPPPDGLAKVRLVSGAATGGAISVSLPDGTALAQDISTGDATGYATVAAQTWTLRVTTASDRVRSTSRVPVQAGGIYSVLVVDSPEGGVELRALLDSASAPTMPKGGVDTGAGGLAPGVTATDSATDSGAGTGAGVGTGPLGLGLGLGVALLAGTAALLVAARRRTARAG